MGRSEDAIDTIRHIAALLSKYGFTEEQQVFLGLIDTFLTSPGRARAAVLSIYRGMGSFNDIVLQDAGGSMPRQDNDELERLRRKLYGLCS